MREIKNIIFSITTTCNRCCKDCVYNAPNKEPIFYDWDYIKRAAKYFKGYKITITGGEPSFHPDFEEMAPRFRDLFECETLGIETNGFGFKLFPEAFKHFDSIHFTHYLSDGDNSEDLKYLVRRFPELVLDGKLIIHRRAKYVSRERKGGGKMCDRGTSPTIAYMNGVVYPCCIGDGFNGAVGVTLSDNWLEELLKIKIPCHKCFLSI